MESCVWQVKNYVLMYLFGFSYKKILKKRIRCKRSTFRSLCDGNSGEGRKPRLIRCSWSCNCCCLGWQGSRGCMECFISRFETCRTCTSIRLHSTPLSWSQAAVGAAGETIGQLSYSIFERVALRKEMRRDKRGMRCVRRGNRSSLAAAFSAASRTQLESDEVLIASQLSPGVDEDTVMP